MNRTVNIQILGKPFTFQITPDISAEDFAHIADYVEKKMLMIKEKMSELDSYRLGLLTAINIAQELFFQKKENEKLREVLNTIDSMLTRGNGSESLPIRLISK